MFFEKFQIYQKKHRILKKKNIENYRRYQKTSKNIEFQKNIEFF
jgi:hypothetical protein